MPTAKGMTRQWSSVGIVENVENRRQFRRKRVIEVGCGGMERHECLKPERTWQVVGNALEPSTLAGARCSNVRRKVNKKYIRIVNAEMKRKTKEDTTRRATKKTAGVLLLPVCKGGDPRDPPPQTAALPIGES